MLAVANHPVRLLVKSYNAKTKNEAETSLLHLSYKLR